LRVLNTQNRPVLWFWFFEIPAQWVVDSVFKIHRTGGSLKNQRTTQHWLGAWVVV
jgi:hypothetical protein